LFAVVAVGASGCEPPRIPDRTSSGALLGPFVGTFSVPEHEDRTYTIHLPPQADGRAALPVVIGFHGGGGAKEGFIRTGCLDGNVNHRDCLNAVAAREGFVIVVPDGVQGRVGRSWNAGGGEDGSRCVGGQACAQGVDDVAYVDALLREVRRGVRVDEDRIHATGLSNGAALAHRLACERADTFASIAAVAGANQALLGPGCEPMRPVPVLQIHGTADTCWGIDGTSIEPVCTDAGVGRFVDLATSMAFWATHNGCSGREQTPFPDVADDGTTTTALTYTDCAATTTFLRVDGGGHTWPDGWQYISARRIGPTTTDWNGNLVIWDFFARHPRTDPTGGASP
jgi:polyhydroxybutyrate depolymerase